MTGSPTSGTPLTAAGGAGGHHGRRGEWHEHHRVRSGDEPLHARSPLRLRMILAVTGLANGVAGILVFLLLLPSLPLVVLFALVCAGSLVNIAVVAHRIHQGPHYQPGPGIPPYRPVQAERPPEPKPPAPTRVRRRRYLILMGVCVLLITMAWTWIRIYSVGAALAMSAVAALIPPFAAAVANVDSPILREQDEAQPPRTGPPAPPPARPPDRR